MMYKFAILSLFMAFSICADSLDYVRGGADGWIAGYCFQKTQCVAPKCPVMPRPIDGKDGYMDGYNKMFIRGLAAGRK